MRLTVDGVEHELARPGLATLLHVLREELAVTGPKAGCQQGSCGACTVLVDGAPRRSCLLPAAALDGAEVATVEGLGAAEHLSPLQAAFLEHHGFQCGFCTPGFLVAAHALLERSPAPSRREIEAALGGHTCRCTGYLGIVEAVEAAAEAGGAAR